MTLIKEKCPHCNAEQTEILAAINVTTESESYNFYRCLKCKKSHTQNRTDAEQQKTDPHVATDRKILEYAINREQEEHDKLSDRLEDIEEKKIRIENKKRLEKLLSKLPK